MPALKAYIKDAIYRVGMAGVLDSILFRYARFRHRTENNRFRKEHPGLPIPPDYFLYETYQLDYREFFADGRDTAAEIVAWTRPYLPIGQISALDWGCGLSRIAMHIHEQRPDVEIHACDVNDAMLNFGRENFPAIRYARCGHTPPLPYEKGSFDLVYAISVFTHLEFNQHGDWIHELHRILRPGGICLFTTHGRSFLDKLTQNEKSTHSRTGGFTKTFQQKGHRMMSTYNDSRSFTDLLSDAFEVLEFHDGKDFPAKAGGQDLWIVKRVDVR